MESLREYLEKLCEKNYSTNLLQKFMNLTLMDDTTTLLDLFTF